MLNGEYRRSLIDTDARILAEDDQHVVVSIRIPKDLLRRNLPLALALADSVSNRAAPPPARISSEHRLSRLAYRTRRLSLEIGAALVHPAVLAINWVLTLIVFATAGRFT